MFDSSIIFQRTLAGRDEIQQKSHGLTQSERLVLIMVDGVSTFQQVRNKLPVLADDRFARAVHKLQAKELILEVFLPVDGQAPEEIERTVIDRFLQQDPLDPVTIIMRDPEEELEFLARFSATPKPQVPNPVPEPQVVEGRISAITNREPPVQQEKEVLDDDELHTELINELANELKERQQARPVRSEKMAFQEGIPEPRHDREGRHRKHLESNRKTGTPHWGYWLIAVGCAFIAGYIFARIGA